MELNSFFKKVDHKALVLLFHKVKSLPGQLTVKQTGGQQVVKVKLVPQLSNLVITQLYILPLELADVNEKTCAFSFKVGTEIYFFKARVRLSNLGFVVDMKNIDVFTLVRRKESRYSAHPDYPIQAYLYLDPYEKQEIAVKFVDLSKSGLCLKLEDVDQMSLIEKKKNCTVYLKEKKHHGLNLNCELVHAIKAKKENTLLGLKIKNHNPVVEAKLKAICEELMKVMFQSEL